MFGPGLGAGGLAGREQRGALEAVHRAKRVEHAGRRFPSAEFLVLRPLRWPPLRRVRGAAGGGGDAAEGLCALGALRRAVLVCHRRSVHELAKIGKQVEQPLRHRWDVHPELREARASHLVAMRHEVADCSMETREARLRSQKVEGQLEPGPAVVHAVRRNFTLLGRVHLAEEVLHEERNGTQKQPGLVQERQDGAEVKPDVL
mmetsp:Transcript_57800/g.159834  ORF Transcript_57800/g.159834 Transcript_57800/m.159834 type:complete len:203 (-) Transcript_57800:284-892(-)